MSIEQYDIWLADLSPSQGTEPGKTRPVVIVQTGLLNNIHPSTIICPITTNVRVDIKLLRVHLTLGQLDRLSDILVDQIRAIDNKRLLKKIGQVTKSQKTLLKENLKIMFDF